MKALKNILKKQFSTSPLLKKINLSLILKFSNDLLEDQFKFDTKIQVRAMQIKDKTLMVACLDENILSELKSKENNIIDIINNHFGEKIIENIRYLA